MVTTRSPKLQKGAFVQIENDSSVQRILEFQYNPEKIDRRIVVNDDPKRKSIRRNRNHAETAPREFIVFNLILDATDALEQTKEKTNTAENGIYSKLSAIEMLVYSQKHSLANRRFLGIRVPGSALIQSLTLLVWGNKRVFPVLIKEIHIIEEMFDSSLNPIRASIEISMWVLNDSDLQHNKKGLKYWNSYIAGKVSFAKEAYKEAHPDDSKNT